MSSSMDNNTINQCPPQGAASPCELETNLEMLRRVPAFSGVPIDRLKLCAYLSKRVRFRPREFLFRQGSPDNQAYVILSGAVQVIREYQDRSVMVNEFHEGDFFGGLALLTDIKRPFSARAVTEVTCVALDRESFKRVFAQYPEIALKLMDVMLKRVLHMVDSLLFQLSSESSPTLTL